MKDTIGSRIKLEIKYNECVSEQMAKIINTQIIKGLEKKLKLSDMSLNVLEVECIDESEEW